MIWQHFVSSIIFLSSLYFFLCFYFFEFHHPFSLTFSFLCIGSSLWTKEWVTLGFEFWSLPSDASSHYSSSITIWRYLFASQPYRVHFMRLIKHTVNIRLQKWKIAWLLLLLLKREARWNLIMTFWRASLKMYTSL